MLPFTFLSILVFGLLSLVTAEQDCNTALPAKYPWIRRFGSIGDSYAAGLGAGKRIDWGCSRYGSSYPNLLHTRYFGGDKNRTHQFLACSGATAIDVLEKQVPSLHNDTDLITVSAGGNDIGLTPILNNCVYQFYMAGEDDCKGALVEARKRIANETELFKNVTRLLNATKPKLSRDGRIYVTGYAGFFGVEDDECNNVTWAVWRDVEAKKQYLRLELRMELNEMVRSVNRILRNATEAAGPSVRFIDYNQWIEDARGRYCESGVHEPAPNRPGLSFYEWDTVDAGEDPVELRRTGDDVPRGSFEADVAERINKTLQEHPDWEFDPDKGFVNKSKIRPEGVVDDTIWWMLPDTWKRVFHPRPEAHSLIAQLVTDDLDAMEQEKHDKAVLLLLIGTMTLTMIAVVLLLVSISRQRTSTMPWPPVWRKNRQERYFDDYDENMVEKLSERSSMPTRQYNTFGGDARGRGRIEATLGEDSKERRAEWKWDGEEEGGSRPWTEIGDGRRFI